MQEITLNYTTSPLRDAITQREADIKQFEIEKFSHHETLYDKFFGNMHYDWMATVNIGLLIISVALFALSLIVDIITRAASKPQNRAPDYALNTAAVGLMLIIINVLLWGLFYILSGPDGGNAENQVPHPDYDQALIKTVEDNRDDIDEAIHYAALSQGIDLERACTHGKYGYPRAMSSSTPYRTDTEKLVQCGGDTFGALLYADTDTMEFQSISTSTGADTFTVIAATGDTARNKSTNHSSVQFPGVSESKYRPYKGGERYAWSVDSSHEADTNSKPYTDDTEMTLDEARKRDNNAASSR